MSTHNILKNALEEEVLSPRDTQQIAVHRLYVKNSIFEAAAMTLALMQETKPPVVDLQVNVTWSERDKNLYEAALNLTLIAKHQDNIIWRVQLSQAGLFTLTGFKDEQRELVLNGYCMNMLYPYACVSRVTKPRINSEQ